MAGEVEVVRGILQVNQEAQSLHHKYKHLLRHAVSALSHIPYQECSYLNILLYKHLRLLVADGAQRAQPRHVHK